MSHTKCIGIFRHRRKAGNERIGKTIGNLKTHTKHHREKEEQCHLLLFKQRESLQSECFSKRIFSLAATNLTLWQGEAIEEKYDSQYSGSHELHLAGFKIHDVYKPHGYDKANSTENPNWREVLYHVHTGFLQCVESNGIGQCQCGHIESDRQRI